MRSDELWEDEATVGDASRRPDRRPQARDGDAPAWSGRVVPLRRDAPPLLKPASGLDIADIAALLLRELGLMVIIFCVIFGLGAVAALRMPKAYTASASLLMQLGKDYVYNPLAGDAARGAIATIDQVVQSEVEILNSTELKKRVIRRLGYRTILPSAPNMWNPRTDAQRAAADTAAVRVLQSGLGTATAPQDNVVRLSFKFSNAQGAALILNTLIDEYQTYRQNVFTDAMGPMLRQQKDSFDRQLAVADAAYQSFLEQNGVGDFTAAKATYSKVYDSVQTDLYTARALLAQDRARLAEVEANLKGVSPEMSVERNLDLTIPTRILTLQQQRQEMLSRYLPQAQPIKDLDAQIASLQAMVNSGQGVGEKDHKMGVNTVYQGLMTQKLDLSADIAAQEGRIAQLEAQSAQVTKKTQDLLGLEAQFNTLSAERDSLQTNIKDFTRRIEENDAQRHMAHGADDAVRVVEKAVPPDRPKSLKSIVLILSFLFASVTALSAGVARIYTRKGFASAGMASR
ncbi:MAG: GumC family protein, partial [Asticcacaulis sp.]